MTTKEAVIAADRFGLGARPGELDRIARDPKGWVDRQWRGKAPRELTVADSAGRVLAILRARRDGGSGAAISQRESEAFVADLERRIRRAVWSDAPAYERLVRFWSNHFTVSTSTPRLGLLAVPFETEAIRPNVTRRFIDLVLAVVRHPAMLLYLDNDRSVGPGSDVGKAGDRGLNENLGREILELHTLGVEGGYTQDDVRQLALILTGWTIADLDRGNRGRFRYDPQAHEPGARVFLDRRYDPVGEAQGVRALRAAARHPSTARHVATKLARHFVADDPPAALVDRLARIYLENDTYLPPVYRALLDAPEAWAPARAKTRLPEDLVLATLRALGSKGSEHGRAILAMREMGQVPFTAPSPAGWGDDRGTWLSPDQLLRRIDFAQGVGQRVGNLIDPREMLEETIGPVADRETRFMIEGAGSAAEGVALLLASPAFQLR